MKVLIVSANALSASPTGPAYIAGAAQRAGHTVEIFECLFAQDPPTELRDHIRRYQPDVIGFSIRLVHAYTVNDTPPYYTDHLDLRPRVKQLVDAIRQETSASIILGGPGFNYYGKDWLEYLSLDYGIRGEADLSFPIYLDRLAKGSDLSTIPGCVFRKDGEVHQLPRNWVEQLDETAFPAYELLNLEEYRQRGISPGILTKRGCAFRCTYCPYRKLEGSHYRLKSAKRVVDEIEHIQRLCSPKMITFCENNFNVPKFHAEAICREILARQINVRWGTGDLRPMGIDADFCDLMKDSGCGYANLSIESASDTMLLRMQRGYTARQVEQSLQNLVKSGIPFGASLMIGAPGETPETVQESLAMLDRYPIPLGTWVTIGICLWTPDQQVLEDAQKAGQLPEDEIAWNLFDAPNYLSPELPKSFMEDLIESLHAKKGYTIQVNQPYAGYRRNELAASPV